MPYLQNSCRILSFDKQTNTDHFNPFAAQQLKSVYATTCCVYTTAVYSILHYDAAIQYSGNYLQQKNVYKNNIARIILRKPAATRYKTK